MSVPCKKLKLTPKKQRDADVRRHTQESKVTSTPQRRSEMIASPDISRISSTGTSERITRSSDSSNENHTDSSHVESLMSSTSRSPLRSFASGTTGSEISGVVAGN